MQVEVRLHEGVCILAAQHNLCRAHELQLSIKWVHRGWDRTHRMQLGRSLVWVLRSRRIFPILESRKILYRQNTIPSLHHKQSHLQRAESR